MKEIKLYNYLGHAKLVDNLGDDFTAVKAARQSYMDGLKGIKADTKLIKYLLDHKHTSPFEQASITWELKMPIFVMRQFVRHRTFRLNEQSGRYGEMSPEFYVPDEWRVGSKEDKQMSVFNEESSYHWDEHNGTLVREANKRSFDAYQELLSEGVAKEQARIVLPLNTMTSITVNIDLSNLMKFFVLRMDNHAQWEIQMLAGAMFKQAFELYPITMNHLNENVLRKHVSTDLFNWMITVI